MDPGTFLSKQMDLPDGGDVWYLWVTFDTWQEEKLVGEGGNSYKHNLYSHWDYFVLCCLRSHQMSSDLNKRSTLKSKPVRRNSQIIIH